MKLDGTQFFQGRSEVFATYLERTNQKELVAKKIAEATSNLFDSTKRIKMLCVGGGTGEADLKVAFLLPEYFFEIENIDPSSKMCFEFTQRAKKLKNVQVKSNQCSAFEISPVKERVDLILCINSIYFLKDWKMMNNNPLLKMYNSLADNGLACIILRSDQSDHYFIKNLAGAGHTYGAQVRAVLSSLEVPYYWETIESEIDISDLYQDDQFKPNRQGVRLLEFLSKGEWKNFSKSRQDSIIKLIQSLKINKGKKSALKSAYEIIWIRKMSIQKIPPKDQFFTRKSIKLAQIVKPLIRNVPNFPIKGIIFRDTSILLQNPKIFGGIIDYAADIYKNLEIDHIIAKDMQGVLWAGALAKQLGVSIIPTFRKDVVPPMLTVMYEHEYNPERILNLPKRAIKRGDKVLIVDYMIATGATVLNMGKLVEHLGGKVVGVFSLMELEYLQPRSILPNYSVHTIIKYKNGD